MKIKDINQKQFSELIFAKNNKVIVEFYAKWCKYCKRLKPIMDRYAKKNNDIQILRVNVDKEKLLAEKYDIETVPTLFLVVDGKIVKSGIGTMTREYEFEEFIGV